MQLIALVMSFIAVLMTTHLTRVGEATAHFEPHSGCVTKRVIVAKARAGDSATPEPWEQRDGSSVRARIVSDGTVEVERCVCEPLSAASVRVLVVRGKE